MIGAWGIGTRHGLWLRAVIAPFVVALAVIAVRACREPPKAPRWDEFYYLTIARDLDLHGTITNGTYKPGAFARWPAGTHFGDEGKAWAAPGRFFAPLYPMLVYVVGRLDPRLAAAVRCHVRHGHTPAQATCPMTFSSLIAVQVALWAVAMLCVFAMAWMLTPSEAVAWLAMIIALATGEAGFYARTYLSENATVPAFIVFMLAAMAAVRTGRTLLFGLAGVSLGLAALSRPAYVYLLYAMAPAMLAASLLLRRRWPDVPRPSGAIAFIAGAFLTLAPWMIRNQILFGDPSLSRGYAEVILLQRVSYNQMSSPEWLVSWIYWLPDFGDSIARKLFRPELYERLGWTNPVNYYQEGGGGAFRDRVLSEAGNDAAVLDLLLRKYVLGDLPWHVLVSLPLTMRGLGVAKYLSVAAVILAWWVGWELHRCGKLVLFLVMALPPLAMAALHGFVSVNIERYNLPMLAVYSVIVAIAAGAAWQRLRSDHG